MINCHFDRPIIFNATIVDENIIVYNDDITVFIFVAVIITLDDHYDTTIVLIIVKVILTGKYEIMTLFIIVNVIITVEGNPVWISHLWIGKNLEQINAY